MARYKWSDDVSNREFKDYTVTSEPDGTNLMSVTSLTETEGSMNIYTFSCGFIATQSEVSGLSESGGRVKFSVCEDGNDPDYTANASDYTNGRRMYVTRFAKSGSCNVCRLGSNTFIVCYNESPSVLAVDGSNVIVEAE